MPSIPAAADALPDWQRELAASIREPAELLRRLHLPAELLPGAERAARLFPLRVTESFLSRIRPGDPDDPLLRQVLPLGAEEMDTPGYVDDPVGDLAAMPVDGVLHKYQGRALLIATGACAIHCRYCFRRHFPYAEANAAAEEWRGALDYLRAHPDVNEIILSGGDPLVLSDRRLAALTSQLAETSVTRLRIHSRLPVVLPSRVTPELLRWFAGGPARPVMVIHANHARELDQQVAAALARLREAGATLLNQAVLLRGVNDSAEALTALSERLFELGTQPYYLHLLDRVRGAAHFDVPEARGRELIREISARLPGYLVPKLVREDAGEPNKTWIGG